MSEALDIRWCGEPERTAELASFFVTNVGPAYISHTEMQGLRAAGPDRWSEDIFNVVQDELGPRLRASMNIVPGRESMPIVVAEIDGHLVGLCYVTFKSSARTPCCIVEDIVVDPSRRGHEIGRKIMDWISDEAQKRDIKRLFLESGIHNEGDHGAHAFFKRAGFEICSVVMMKEL